ncbi:MAG: scyllo-inosose 3-dehydrogenase [Anaerolineae bacterium]|nr:scyllo-inosose 3-dehydrogenase [Anaerolineae bacterium]MDW8100403.1 scyllo-inosose 3-dehydrogenase [Anaerolineae bacterium]
MKALVLDAQWDPRPDYPLSDWERATGKAITGSSVWRYPRLEVREVPEPTPKPDQVLIRVKACGVCGSDIHFYETDADGYILYPGLTRFPTTTGHEFSGEIVEVGSEVKDLKVGDMVTAEEMIWCGHCLPCRSGFFNHCANLEELGFTIPGAFAEYVAVGAKYCWKLNALRDRYGDEETAYEAGALVEPCGVAYNALFVRAGGFRPGAYVVVYGAGPIGLAVIAECRAAGAAKIIAFEVSKPRLELARKMGADYAFNPREVVPHEVVMELTEGQGADLHVEATGMAHLTVPEMEKSLAINGKICQLGRGATRVPMYLETLQVRRGQLFGSQGHSGDGIFSSVIRMMAAGLMDMTQIITARYDLNGVVDAIIRSGDRADGKIMVKPA